MMSLSIDAGNSPYFDAWAQRPTSQDLKAAIAAVEEVDEENIDYEDSHAGGIDGGGGLNVHVEQLLVNHGLPQPRSPWHANSFQKANNNFSLFGTTSTSSGWDRRPSSSDLLARIRALEGLSTMSRQAQEEEEEKHQQEEEDEQSAASEQAVADEEQQQRKESDEISLLSNQSIPQSFSIPESKASTVAPTVSSASMALSPPYGLARGLATKSNEEKLSQMEEKRAEPEDIDAIVEGKLKEAVEESEEQRKRRKKAEARAKRFEDIATRRHDFDDDAASAVSGLSKRKRMKRKKKEQKHQQQLEAIQQEEEMKEAQLKAAEVEKKERARKMKAEARAKKFEAAMSGRLSRSAPGKNADDELSVVSGISKRHRMRRKKAALPKVNVEERKRTEWKQNVYSSVLNAEKKRWQRSIYANVLNAEATRAVNVEAKQELDEQNAAAEYRLEQKKRTEENAKKLAKRAKRFEQVRLTRRDGGGAEDDDASVVSSASRMRRRRGRKSLRNSSVHQQQQEATVEEAEPVSAVSAEKEERQQWCNQVYNNVLMADQNRWKRKVYANVLASESAHKERMELQARIAKDRAAAHAKKEKEKKKELRAQKMEQMFLSRNTGNGVEENDDASVVSSASRMRRRRGRKSAKRGQQQPQTTLEEQPQPQSPVEEDSSAPSDMATEGDVSQPQAPVEGDSLAPSGMTMGETQTQECQQWCSNVYCNVLMAEQSRWKKNIYSNVLISEEKSRSRLELQARIAKDRAAEEARKERERKMELRAKKMEQMSLSRSSYAEENTTPTQSPRASEVDDSVHSVASASTNGKSKNSKGTTLMKKMRSRRKKAAKKASK